MEFGMSFGGLYSDPHTYLKYAREAEKLGYDYLFYADSQMVYRDPFSNMAAAALVTKKIKLGTLVSPVVTRDPTVLANAIYTVNEFSKGRALLVVGTGDSSVRRIGKKPAKLKEFAEAVDYIRGLLRGEKFNFGTGEFGIRFAKEGIPVYTIATGPSMLKLSGKIGDGTVISVGPGLMEWAIEQAKKGAEEAGVDFKKRRLMWVAVCSIHQDRQIAKYRVKPNVTWFVVNSPELARKTGLSLGDTFWRRIEHFRNNYARYDLHHSDTWEQALKDAEFVPETLVDEMVLAGNPEDLVKKIRRLEKLGVDTVIIRPPSTEDWEKVFRMFGQHVIPAFSR